jgi:hypothetical protein
VTLIAEDLTKLSPKRLERRLEELWLEALPCIQIVAWSASPERGLTAGLWIESQGRRDVLDLGRVVETEPGGKATVAWSLLTPNRNHPAWRLLLHVDMQRPVVCAFSVGFEVEAQPPDELRSRLPILLAASTLALAFDGFPTSARPLPEVRAPENGDPLVDLLTRTSAL